MINFSVTPHRLDILNIIPDDAWIPRKEIYDLLYGITDPRAFNMSVSDITSLSLLRGAGFIASKKSGRRFVYRRTEKGTTLLRVCGCNI